MQRNQHIRTSICAAGMLLVWLFPAQSVRSEGAYDKPTTATSAVLERGRMLYHMACSPCHGSGGAGDGPLAFNLHTKPRDLTKGVFKNRTTASGQLPADYDLYRNITRGIRTTAMPAFQYIAAIDRWAIVQYIKTFSPRFSDSSEYPLDILKIGQPVPPGLESLRRGRALYVKMQCWKCHGIGGAGDGPAAGTQEDDFHNPIRTTDLTDPSDYKFARSVIDVYRIYSTGLNGAPMPSYVSSMSEEERWDLANYTWALQSKDQYQDGLELKDVEVQEEK